MTEPRSEPDIHTLAWWKQQIAGLQHTVNLLSLHTREAFERSAAVQKEWGTTWPEEREEIQAKLGQVSNDLAEMQNWQELKKQLNLVRDRLDQVVEKQEKMAAWLKERCSKCQQPPGS